MEPTLEKDLRLKIAESILKLTLPALSLMLVFSLLQGLMNPPFIWKRYSITFAGLIIFLITMILNKKGKIRISTLVFTIIASLIVMAASVLNGGTYTSSYVAFSLILITSVLFYRIYVSIAVYSIVVIFSYLIVYLQNRGILPPPPPPLPALNYTTLLLVLFGMLMLVVYVSFRQLLENMRIRIDQTQDLERKERLTQTFFNAISDGIITLDKKGSIIQMNRAAESLEYKNPEGSKTTLYDHFPLSSEEGVPYRLPENLKEPIREPQLILHHQGKKVPVVLSGDPIINRNDECEGIVLTIRDITEEKELQSQLLHTQKMEAIGQLASGVAHDFNNMLGGILIASEHLEDRVPKEEKEMIKIIQSAGERASRLARQLLDFTRKRKTVSSSVDIHEVLTETRTILEQTLDRSIKLEYQLSAEKHFAVGDDNQIMNSLINMAINSSHAMPAGGTLKFQTSNVFLSEQFCSSAEETIYPGDYLRIDVIDDGAGIPAELLSRIFDPFFTSKGKGEGTGLGLTSVKTMVQAHNGLIRVYSEPGRGTSFNLYIPTVNRMENRVDVSSGFKEGMGETILLVDDEEIIRVTVKAMLENLNYKIITAENGEEGLEILKKERPDLVILDMIMPGMNGRKTFEEMIKIFPHIAVFLASGFSKEEDVGAMRRLGLKGFISKPYSRRELSQKLYRFFQEENT